MSVNSSRSTIRAPRRRSLRILLLIGVVGLAVLASLLGFVALVPPPPYTPLVGQNASQVSLFALGDQGTGGLQQWRVAKGMERIAEREGGVNMAVLLGDNFYGKDLSGIDDFAWQLKFERVYHGRWLSQVPFYAVLGNHDYPGSASVELEYGRRGVGSGRWKMPDPYYTQDFAEADGRPLLRVVFLDTSQDVAGLQRQAQFLEESFAKPGPAPIWKMVVAHHAIRAGGDRGDNQVLMDLLLPALQKSAVDVYLSAHEHNQQLILHPGEPAWLISGGGGNDLDATGSIASPAKSTDSRVLLAERRHGFARLAFTPEQLRVAYYDADGGQEHPFTWARSCPWTAEGCLQPGEMAQIATNRATGQ
ncbi:metallophosphoesterase [Pseudomonas sp. CAN2814]|uniref:metallophosphoesterase n=1 Tax=Pseudomonas sp. CAN1 TaxID=3046726 RepID=UPI00264749B2|nr:metallophosphoesterase [Pseudomonas sp. CAN1]MDN6858567.1 metallophosphoesterase [Pseudomonas sp. CAN1]